MGNQVMFKQLHSWKLEKKDNIPKRNHDKEIILQTRHDNAGIISHLIKESHNL